MTNKNSDYPIQPIPFTAVEVKDTFWLPRMETNRKVSIAHNFQMCQETGRIDNFAKAAGLMEGKHMGYPWGDSDVYKVIEAAVYSMAIHPNSELDNYVDELIVKIAAAQEQNGYLYTPRTGDPKDMHSYCGPTRWSHQYSHELFNVGHLYEAAVAHYQITGKRTLLDVALKNAELLCRVFGPGKKFLSNHPEVELALIKLYQITNEKKYLNLAKYFLDEVRAYYGAGWRHDREAYEQYAAAEHSVMALYTFCGMLDFAVLSGDAEYIRLINLLWENIVSKQLYITAGLGSSGESFGGNYKLPNSNLETDTPPAIETCAAIGNALWNHRMFLLHGHAQYLDVLERVIYNGFLAGVSLDGKTFFYANPLEYDGKSEFNMGSSTRQEWFSSACCPTNVVRFMPLLPGFAYARRNDTLYVNFYMSNSTEFEMKGQKIELEQNTKYPWDGTIKILLKPQQPTEFGINLRIPGWALGQPVPGNLYKYLKKNDHKITIKINNEQIAVNMEKGFAVIKRTWNKNDLIELNLPMPVRRVLCNEKVVNNVGKVAIERGPIVYCAEGVDNGKKTLNLILPDKVELKSEYRKDILNGVMVIKSQDFTAIPYYSWANRGQSEMAVWLKRG